MNLLLAIFIIAGAIGMMWIWTNFNDSYLEKRKFITKANNKYTAIYSLIGNDFYWTVGTDHYVDLTTNTIRRLSDDSVLMEYSDDPVKGMGTHFHHFKETITNLKETV